MVRRAYYGWMYLIELGLECNLHPLII